MGKSIGTFNLTELSRKLFFYGEFIQRQRYQPETTYHLDGNKCPVWSGPALDFPGNLNAISNRRR